jgi:hypothetical protein
MAEKKNHKIYPLPSQKTWNSICAKRESRDLTKQQLQEIETRIKSARRELDELGSQSEENIDFQKACARKERSLREREFYKESLAEMADDVDNLIGKAMQGLDDRLFDDAVVEVPKPTNADLYKPERPEGHHDQPVGGDVPNPRAKGVGHPGKVKGLGFVAAEGVAEQLNADIKELGFDDAPSLVAELIVAGYPTVGHLAIAADKHEDGAIAVLIGNGFTRPVSEMIAKKLASYRTKHRKADQLAEKEAKGEKVEGGIGHDTGGAGVGTAKNTRRGAGAGPKDADSVSMRKAPRVDAKGAK